MCDVSAMFVAFFRYGYKITTEDKMTHFIRVNRTSNSEELYTTCTAHMLGYFMITGWRWHTLTCAMYIYVAEKMIRIEHRKFMENIRIDPMFAYKFNQFAAANPIREAKETNKTHVQVYT